MLALMRLVVLALVASFGTASGALANPAKPSLRALGCSGLIASASSASRAAECVGKLGLHVRHARQDQRLGQYENVETGLYYNKFRYYDTQAGQYLAQDPIGLAGGAALYGYVHDPLAWVDPLGLSGCNTSDDVPKINWGQQEKHFPGHNSYTPGRSTLTANPEALARRAGTGQQVGGTLVGLPGSKERVDFGEPIGRYFDPGGTSSPTTVGIIHYGKHGIHNVPARPSQ